MTSFDPETIVLNLFLRVRKRFDLGMAEYFLAKDALVGGWGDNLEELRETLGLLWCHSREDRSDFVMIWDEVTAKVNIEESRPSSPKPDSPDSTSTDSVADDKEIIEDIPLEIASPSQINIAPLPVFAPKPETDLETDSLEIQGYFPIPRRNMIYCWRYLRRTVADGPYDILDVAATVQQAAKQGFYLAPCYKRREQNHSRLLLLADQNGSMMPFHRFTRELVETAQYESPIGEVAVFYFHNVPGQNVYRDVYLTEAIALDKVLSGCDSDTSILIISDAGAARGYRRLERTQATIEVLLKIKKYTPLVAWLNPMPKKRWSSTSAQIIAYAVPMRQMDTEGLRDVVDILRGQ
jgi:uncharacterized protein